MKLSAKFNSPLITNAAKMVSSNIFMYLLPFIVTPILSRIYDPSLFGEWGVFSSTFQIINVVLFLCYDYTIVKVTDKEYPLACVLSLIISVLVILFVALVFVIGYFSGFVFFINFPSKIFFFSILAISAVTVILQNVANRKQSYWVLSVSSIVLGIAQAVCRIFFGFFAIFPNGLIVGTTLAQLFCLFFMLYYVGKQFTNGFFSNCGFNSIIKFALKYKKFPLFDAPAALLTFATFNLSLIILSTFYSKSEIGSLSIIHQMLLLPISLVGGALGKVYYQQISDSVRDNLSIVDVSRKMLRIVLYISILPSLFLALGGDELICIFLGSKWENAGAVAICMAIWSIPTILTQPLIPVYRHYSKQNYMLFYNIINFVLAVGSLVVSCYLGFNIYVTLLLYSWLSAFSNYMMFFSIVKLTKVDMKCVFRPGIIILHILTISLLLYKAFQLL